jgi:hypothetical protein
VAAAVLSLLFVVVLYVVVAFVVVPAGATPSAPAQTTTTAAPDDPAATAPPAADAPADETPATTMPSTTTPALEDRATESEQATTRLNWVVIALLILAAVIAAATVYFWFRTRPSRSTARADRPGRSARTGAVLVAPDGTEQRLVDPGPASFADVDDRDLGPLPDDPKDDPWAVRPPPQLPQREPGAGPSPGSPRRPERAPASPAPEEPAMWWASRDGGDPTIDDR